MLKMRENVLVTKGDLAVFAKGSAVYSMVGSEVICNVPAGQPVIMDIKTLLALDQTNVATNPNPIRVGVSLGGDIRWLGGEEFYPSTIKTVSKKTPVCGVPDVEDIWWKCTECYEDYAINLAVRDNDTQSYSSAATDWELYTVNARPDCNACPEDCTATATCDLVRDALVTELQTQLNELDIKAYVTALYANSFIYCFTHSDDCGQDCSALVIDASSEATVNGVAIDLAGITPAAPASMAQLLEALNAIKTALEASADFVGTAFITKGFGANCCVQLHINTPNTFVLKDGAGNVIAPCETETPQADHVDMCGMRVIAAPVTQDSACLITKPLANYTREVRLYPASDSFYDAVTEHPYNMTVPQNFGNFVQYEEYRQETGGQGRNYRKTNTSLIDGFDGLNKDQKSRLMNAFSYSDVNETYVSYQIVHAHPHEAYGNLGIIDPGKMVGSIYIPECDTTTIASVSSVIDAMSAVAGLPGNINANLVEGRNF